MQLDCGKPRGVLARGDAVARDHDELARLDVALVFGAEQVEGAGLGGEDDDVGAAVFSTMRPMESGRKPRGSRAAKMRSRVIMTIGESAVDLRERVGDGVDQRSRPASAR